MLPKSSDAMAGAVWSPARYSLRRNSDVRGLPSALYARTYTSSPLLSPCWLDQATANAPLASAATAPPGVARWSRSIVSLTRNSAPSGARLSSVRDSSGSMIKRRLRTVRRPLTNTATRVRNEQDDRTEGAVDIERFLSK